MWIFTARLPKHVLLLAPRGPYPTPLRGYGWHSHQAAAWPSMDDFRPAVQALLELINLKNFPMADFTRLSVGGFSQGAALAYTFALLERERLVGLAGISGFVPGGADAIALQRPLEGLPVFMAHGSLDELVSVERARNSAELLERAGADLVYCEEQVGHKLSAGCFRGLGRFFATIYPTQDIKDSHE